MQTIYPRCSPSPQPLLNKPNKCFSGTSFTSYHHHKLKTPRALSLAEFQNFHDFAGSWTLPAQQLQGRSCCERPGLTCRVFIRSTKRNNLLHAYKNPCKGCSSPTQQCQSSNPNLCVHLYTVAPIVSYPKCQDSLSLGLAALLMHCIA